MTNTIDTRIIQKHDLEVNWQKSIDFTPFKAELIIYDAEIDNEGNILQLPEGRTEPYANARVKIGDGHTKVNDLPFASNSIECDVVGAVLTTSDWTLGEDNRYYQIVPVENVTVDTPIIIVDCALDGVDLDADLEILEAWKLPSINNVKQDNDSLTFYTYEIPSINIPINIGIIN